MHEPRVRFLIGGMQKCGTTALASYLGAHPRVALPLRKEAHVFDAPDFDDGWDAAAVDARFASRFGDVDASRLCGDATPVTVFHAGFVARVSRYNPSMRWVLLLRDPVERAISHYFMERARGQEPLGLALAVLSEQRRLRGHEDDWSSESPMRKWSYAARSRYARQLDVLFGHFDPAQVLLLRTRDLSARPAATLARVVDFLGLPEFAGPPEYRKIFAGDYPDAGLLSPGRWWLRYVLRGEVATLRRRHGIDLQADATPAQR